MRDEHPTLRRHEQVLVALGIALGLLGTMAILMMLAGPRSWYDTWRLMALLAFPGMYLANAFAILVGFGSPHGMLFLDVWMLFATPINVVLYCGALLGAAAAWKHVVGTHQR